MNNEIITHIKGIPIYRQSVGILPANKNLANRARALRKAGVLSEVLFWLQVRNKTFWSIDFDRQSNREFHRRFLCQIPRVGD